MIRDITIVGDQRIRIKQLGYNPSGESFDPDAAAYFARAGVTDSTAKTKISNCFIQLKANGYWNDITLFHIGRSLYNAGSGTTVYDAKNAAKDGTIVNGTTWSTDGLVFNGTTQAVDIPHNQSMNDNWSAFAVVKDGVADINPNRRVFGTDDVNGATLLFLQGLNKADTELGCFDGTTAAASTLTVDVTSFSLIGIASTPGNQVFFQNNNAFDSVTIALAAGTHGVQLGSSRVAGESMTAGVMSVSILFGGNAFNPASLYQIFRNTICSDQLP